MEIKIEFHFFHLQFLSVTLVMYLQQSEYEIVVKGVMPTLSMQQVNSSNFLIGIISAQNVKFAERAGSTD